MKHSGSIVPNSSQQIVLFLRTLAENPRLRPLVRRLAIYNTDKEDLYADPFPPFRIRAGLHQIKVESDPIYYTLEREGAIPFAELKRLLPLARDFNQAHHWHPGGAKVMDGLYQTILLCLPELQKLTLARPLSLRFFVANFDPRNFPEEPFDLVPDTFLPKLTHLTLDKVLLPTNCQLGKVTVVDQVMAVIPITCHRPLQKLRIIGLDTDPWGCHTKIRANPEDAMPVQHLHLNQMRLDYRDARSLISQMPHLETLHLQRVSLGGPVAYRWRPERHALGHSNATDSYILRDLLKPVATTLRCLNLDLRLLSDDNFIMYGKNKRVSTLKYMETLRHLTITADAIVGRMVLPRKVRKLNLNEYFPRKLETLTIREAIHVDHTSRSPHKRTAEYIEPRRAEAMCLLLEKIADVYIDKQAKSTHHQHIRKVTLSAQYSTELGKLAHWSRFQSGMKKVWEAMEEDGRFRLEKIREKSRHAGIEFEVEEEPSLDLDVDF